MKLSSSGVRAGPVVSAAPHVAHPAAVLRMHRSAASGMSMASAAPAAAAPRAPRAHAASARRQVAVRAAASEPPKAAPITQMLVFVPPHPLVKHWLAVCRNSMTPSGMFRGAMAELGRILIYEAVRDLLPTLEGQIDTPMGTADVEFVDPTRPIKVVPVLRAGLVLLEEANQVLPVSATYHVGYVRDEKTLEATPYLNKLPAKFDADDRIVITDVMLATGGTIMKVMDEIVSRGANPENIRIVSAVCAPPAMVKLSEKYKGLKVFTAMIDPEVDKRGFIIPGLGDAGDRAFGNV